MQVSWIALALVVVASACASAPPDQAGYLREIRSAPTTFRIARALDQTAWKRARSFVTRFSSMKVKNATDSVLQTYHPPSDESRFGYRVTRRPARSGVTFTVKCLRRDRWEKRQCQENAGIAATYIRTGELPYPGLIHR